MLPLIFIIITLLSFFLFYIGTGKDRGVLIFYPLWILTIGILSLKGFFQNVESVPPRILLVIVPSTLYTIYFYRNIGWSRLQTNYLLSIHILRLPVEIVLYQLFLQGGIPQIMTFYGWNYDVLIGITAIGLLIYLKLAKKEPRGLLVVWNIVGLVFLSVIVTTAVFSSPSPVQQFAFDQPNTAILEFPYTLLPAVVVPIVLLSHLLSLRALIRKRI